MKPLTLSLAALVLAACGDGSSAIVARIDLTAFEVTEQVDRLHVQLSTADEVFVERTYMLDQDEVSPTLTLVRGPRTPRRLDLRLFADLGNLPVAQSDATVAFKDGDTVEVDLVVSQ